MSGMRAGAGLEVEPAELGRTAAALRRSLEVARQVADERGGLLASLGDAGSDHLAAAGRTFLDRWGHGCRLLAEDGDALAELLESASRCYLEVEAAAADAFRSGR